MDGVREVVERAKSREVKLMTSALTLVEVLSSRPPVGFDTLFQNFMRRIDRVNVDTKVATLSHDIRTVASTEVVEFRV